VEHFQLSERVACQLVGLSRTGYHYKAKPKNDQALRERLKTQAAQHSRYGYLLLHGLLKAEGLVINKKRTYRLYTEEGLQVRTKKRKKLQRPRLPMEVPKVARFLDQLGEARSLPPMLVCDNGPEFTSKAMFFWTKERNTKLGFIQPSMPTQNAFEESLNGKFRNECLNQHWFRSLDIARWAIEQWRKHYNQVRPPSAMGYLPPVEYAKRAA